MLSMSDARWRSKGCRAHTARTPSCTYFGTDVETVPCAEFRDLFHAVDRGLASMGVLPVENSIEGSVTVANDLLLESDLSVVGEVLVWVRHCLIGQPDAELDRHAEGLQPPAGAGPVPQLPAPSIPSGRRSPPSTPRAACA